MTSESNCWLTFLLNRIFTLPWINKSEAFRKQKESDEQHQRSTKALEAASNSLCSGHRILTANGKIQQWSTDAQAETKTECIRNFVTQAGFLYEFL
ncbi:hypothetical protein T01_2597, partial [Trichinella spiralis]